MSILETKGLSLFFGGLKAVDNVDFKVKEGEIVGLIGPNGAGKTTFFNIITGYLKPNEGNVFFRNEKITGLQPHKIAQRGLVRTFQIMSIFEDSAVKENVIIGRYLKWKDSLLDALFNTQNNRKQHEMLESKAEELLEFVGLADKSNLLAKNLAFGEQKRMEFAIALAAEPKMLLLDEPATGMNAEECFKLIKLIKDIRKTGITILIVEHNMKVVMELCSRIFVLNYGSKIAEGNPVEIANNRKVISVYLGENANASCK